MNNVVKQYQSRTGCGDRVFVSALYDPTWFPLTLLREPLHTITRALHHIPRGDAGLGFARIQQVQESSKGLSAALSARIGASTGCAES